MKEKIVSSKLVTIGLKNYSQRDVWSDQVAEKSVYAVWDYNIVMHPKNHVKSSCLFTSYGNTELCNKVWNNRENRNHSLANEAKYTWIPV